MPPPNRMARRRLGAGLISIIVVFLATTYPAHADLVEFCPQNYNPSQVPVVFDHSQDSAEYSPAGWLIYRLRLTSPSASGDFFNLTFRYLTDHCETATFPVNTGQIDLAADTVVLSIRFSSMTDYEIWDDTHGALLKSGSTIGPIPPYASFFPITSRDSNSSNFNFGHAYQVKEGARPPIVESTITPPEGCPLHDMVGFLPFDFGYERVEYVDGLLRVHLRFNGATYPNDVYEGDPPFKATVRAAGNDCSRNPNDAFPSGLPSVGSPGHVWYFSYRFTSPTHWVLWDDENNRPFEDETGSPHFARCFGNCSGDLPEGSTYAYFMAAQNSFSGFQTFRTSPYFIEEPAPIGCTENCNSNVLIIPGIKATELYEGSSKRWLPGLFNFDGQHLAMTTIGESVNPITVGDPIGSVTFASVKILEIYGDFFDFLDSLRSTGVIVDWQAAPYDWRYDVYDVVSQDQKIRDGSTRMLVDQIHELASTSKTGKVTIVAHSNGGLVGKALIGALGQDANLVDRFIMVGTPQLGTPSAIAAMLHGTGQGLPIDAVPFAMSKATSREISENMPGAYGLLPLAMYFNVVSDPVVEFDNSPFTDVYRDAYGETVDTQSEMIAFLLGTGDGRAKPPSSNTLTPTILNDRLLFEAVASRNSLESWLTPTDVEVIQIAGWGLDTMRGFRYRERACSTYAECKFLDIEPVMTGDGDGTVVSPSASAMVATSYFFDMSSFNNENNTKWTHANMLAATSVQDLIRDIITDVSRDASFITSTKPVATDLSKRLHISVHSPITLGIRDSNGRFTGVVTNPDPLSDIPVVVRGVPNTYYFEFGEGKYTGFEVSEEFEIVMQGTGSGTFTLEIEEVEGDEVIGFLEYSNIPVSTSTGAILYIHDTQNKGQIELDVDGDGLADAEVRPDGDAQTLSYLLILVKQKILNLDTGDKFREKILRKIELLEEQAAKEKNVTINVDHKILKQAVKGRMSDADAQALIDLLEEIENAL
jgi:pimeloyl-ACP methyl ester carboxylesterase